MNCDMPDEMKRCGCLAESKIYPRRTLDLLANVAFWRE